MKLRFQELLEGNLGIKLRTQVRHRLVQSRCADLHLLANGFLIHKLLELDHLQCSAANLCFHRLRDFAAVLLRIGKHRRHFALQVDFREHSAIDSDNWLSQLICVDTGTRGWDVAASCAAVVETTSITNPTIRT